MDPRSLGAKGCSFAGPVAFFFRFRSGVRRPPPRERPTVDPRAFFSPPTLLLSVRPAGRSAFSATGPVLLAARRWCYKPLVAYFSGIIGRARPPAASSLGVTAYYTLSAAVAPASPSFLFFFSAFPRITSAANGNAFVCSVLAFSLVGSLRDRVGPSRSPPRIATAWATVPSARAAAVPVFRGSARPTPALARVSCEASVGMDGTPADWSAVRGEIRFMRVPA